MGTGIEFETGKQRSRVYTKYRETQKRRSGERDRESDAWVEPFIVIGIT